MSLQAKAKSDSASVHHITSVYVELPKTYSLNKLVTCITSYNTVHSKHKTRQHQDSARVGDPTLNSTSPSLFVCSPHESTSAAATMRAWIAQTSSSSSSFEMASTMEDEEASIMEDEQFDVVAKEPSAPYMSRFNSRHIISAL